LVSLVVKIIIHWYERIR